MTATFKKTIAQKKAVKIIASSDAKNICIEGGSRAGKSFEIMREIIIRASKEPNSDHLICRETFNAAARSIWMKTLPDVFRICFPDLAYQARKELGIFHALLPNGSKIFLAGLDDAKKLERLLGTEYSTIWFNETNQIPFTAVSKLKTRLAQKNGLKNKAYYDLNPTKTSSWVYQVFHQKVNPTDGEMLPNPDKWIVIRMNPEDNVENLDDEYLAELEALPEKEKLRFLKGEYDTDNSGSAVYAFDREEHVDEIAVKQPGTIFCGTDFNFKYNSDIIASQTATQLYVWDEVQIEGDTFKKADALKKKGATGATVVADGTGKALRTSGISDHQILKDAGFTIKYKTNPRVVDKIANLNRCFSLGLIKINPKCKKLIRDLTQLVWDKKGDLDQKTDPSLSHLVDGLAYLCWTLYPLMEEKKSTSYIL